MLPVADVLDRVKEVELGSPEGTINLATLSFCAGVSLLPTVVRAAGALVDRIIFLILVLRRQLPDGYQMLPWVEPRDTRWEFGVLITVGTLCFTGLVLTS